MKRVAIVGGGISGLSAAYYLEKSRRQGADCDWVLFEKSQRLGGVIRTERRDGFVLEAGPDSFLSAKLAAVDLCRELGLAGDIIHSNDSARKTYIVVDGRIVPIPDGLQFMVPTRVLPILSSPLFSLRTKTRMMREYFMPARSRNGDESVGDFVRRHFGQEMVDRVAEPLLAGVYGGNADHLSIRAVLPRFAEMEQREGSLVRATMKALKNAGRAAPQPLFTTLRHGMQQLVDALVATLPPPFLRLKESVSGIQHTGNQWQVESSGSSERFDVLILAVPAPFAAALLSDSIPPLQRIEYTSSAAVLVACDQANLPPGFGFLVPASEGKELLACTFVHNKFSCRAPEGAALLRCFFTSARLPNLLECSDQALIDVARQELKEILRVNLSPRFTAVFRWSHGLPQYETGHVERTAEIEAQIKKTPGLYLIGNSLHGIGVPDCIRSARKAIELILNA